MITVPGCTRRRAASLIRYLSVVGMFVLLFGPTAGRIWQRLGLEAQVAFSPPGKRPPERMSVTMSSSAVVTVPSPPPLPERPPLRPPVADIAPDEPLLTALCTVAPDTLRGPPASAIV